MNNTQTTKKKLDLETGYAQAAPSCHLCALCALTPGVPDAELVVLVVLD